MMDDNATESRPSFLLLFFACIGIGTAIGMIMNVFAPRPRIQYIRVPMEYTRGPMTDAEPTRTSPCADRTERADTVIDG